MQTYKELDIHEIFEFGYIMLLGWENPYNPKPGKAYECFPQHIKEQCKQLKSDDIKDVSPIYLKRLIV